jgi:hypothetical protein
MTMRAEKSPSGPPPGDSESHSGLAAIALLGRLDQPTDGVRDYCSLLSQAFLRRGDRLDLAEVRWEDQGWFKSLWQLWKDSRAWNGPLGAVPIHSLDVVSEGLSLSERWPCLPSSE